MTPAITWTRRLALAALAVAACGSALAQSTPIRFIVPFPPGGAADQTARIVAQEASSILATPIVIENKGGAGGMIGAELAARAKPDGKTFFVGSNGPLVLNTLLYAKMPYDPEKAFVPVAGFGKSPLLLVTRKDLGASSVQDLIAKAKAASAPLSMASAGNGNITHLTGEYAAALLGFKVNHIPFAGSAPAMTSVMSGNVDLMFDALPSSMPQAKGGMVRPLVILDDRRFPQLPDVPTLRELGYPESDISAWIALVAPAGTPREAIVDMNRAVNEALKKPDVVARLQAIGEQPMPGSPDDLARFIGQERARWTPLANKLGIRPE